MTALRALVALALLAGFYVLAWSLVLGYVALIGFVVVASAFADPNVTFRAMGSIVPLVGGMAPAVAAITHSLLVVGRSPGVPPGSVQLRRDDAPGVWDTVVELAERVGAPMPSRLYLTAEANAAVSEDTRLLGLRVTDRRLYIGMPLLVGLPADELRAVLCHELGHYARGHTRFGAMTYRGSVALAVTRERIALAANANPMVRAYSGVQYGLLSAYAWIYDGASLAVRRRQEFEADAAAASVVGAEVAAEALRSAHALTAAWDDFRSRFLDPMAKAGHTPDDPFSAFEAMLADPDYRDVLAESRACPPEQPKSRLDSHPGLASRLARLASCPTAPAERDRSPAKDLLGNPRKFSVRLRRAAWPTASRSQPWRDWLRSVAQKQATEPARGLIEAAQRLGAPATLGGVLDLIEAGRAPELAVALADARSEPEVPADVGRNLLVAAVFVLVGQGLVKAGAATWTVAWAAQTRLVAGDTTPAELFDLVHAAVERPTEVPRLRLHLASSGVDVELPLAEPAPERHGPGEPLVVVQPANLDEQRRIRNIALPIMVVVLMAILIGVATAGRNNPAPRQSGLSGVDWSDYQALPTDIFQPPRQPSWSLPPPLLPTFPRALPSNPWQLMDVVTVEPGDNLSVIACRHQTTVAELVRLNDLSSTDLAIGQELLVPAPADPAIAATCGY